ncbi:MAG: hypothetical protein A2W17_02215 [Planctomycetes bacterium RBG_16_41_13]|nr:MAG: hypothetical protein A2W17_02215 [Planctomycetes bacterium RBG_16_41_13]
MQCNDSSTVPLFSSFGLIASTVEIFVCSFCVAQPGMKSKQEITMRNVCRYIKVFTGIGACIFILQTKHFVKVIVHRRGCGERGENKYNGRLHNFLFLSPKNLIDISSKLNGYS